VTKPRSGEGESDGVTAETNPKLPPFRKPIKAAVIWEGQDFRDCGKTRESAFNVLNGHGFRGCGKTLSAMEF
jgi:hypothetical protein